MPLSQHTTVRTSGDMHSFAGIVTRPAFRRVGSISRRCRPYDALYTVFGRIRETYDVLHSKRITSTSHELRNSQYV